MIRAVLHRNAIAEFFRYLAVSVIALALDMGCLLLAAKSMHYLWAATLGFAVGAVASYLLAIRWAFRHRRLAGFPEFEFAAYAIIGVVGLALNNLTIFVGVEYLALSLPSAKLVAAATTFLFNFAARKWGLFRP